MVWLAVAGYCKGKVEDVQDLSEEEGDLGKV